MTNIGPHAEMLDDASALTFGASSGSHKHERGFEEDNGGASREAVPPTLWKLVARTTYIIIQPVWTWGVQPGKMLVLCVAAPRDRSNCCNDQID